MITARGPSIFFLSPSSLVCLFAFFPPEHLYQNEINWFVSASLEFIVKKTAQATVFNHPPSMSELELALQKLLLAIKMSGNRGKLVCTGRSESAKDSNVQ